MLGQAEDRQGQVCADWLTYPLALAIFYLYKKSLQLSRFVEKYELVMRSLKGLLFAVAIFLLCLPKETLG